MAVAKDPAHNFALISVPGDYAAAEAMKALRLGMDVMVFSDNVPPESELALKRYAQEHNLMVMGPDCGTAIVNGVPWASPMWSARSDRRGRRLRHRHPGSDRAHPSRRLGRHPGARPAGTILPLPSAAFPCCTGSRHSMKIRDEGDPAGIEAPAPNRAAVLGGRSSAKPVVAIFLEPTASITRNGVWRRSSRRRRTWLWRRERKPSATSAANDAGKIKDCRGRWLSQRYVRGIFSGDILPRPN
jgi:hypothetical protein